jgi:hypothetical protein
MVELANWLGATEPSSGYNRYITKFKPTMNNLEAKIRKLLALGESSNPNEAMAAIAKANALIAESGIIITDGKAEVCKVTHMSSSKYEQLHDCWILTGFKNIYGFKIFMSKATNACYLYGLPSSTSVALHMLEYVRDSMATALKEIPAAEKKGKDFRKNFRRGYCLTVMERLLALSKEPEAAAINAMVLVPSLSGEIDSKLESEGYTVESKKYKVYNSEGLNQGANAADSLSLNKQVLPTQLALNSAS